MNRIDIRLEGERIDLPPGLSVTLERFNPLFSYDTVQGNKVNPFSLPLSDTNNRFFNWYYQLQSSYPDRVLKCQKYADGVLIEQGFVQLENVSTSGYSVFYTQNLGEIFRDHQNTTLNLLNLGSEPLPAAFSLAGNERYVLPVIENPGWYAQTVVPGFTGRVNDVSAGTYLPDTPKVPMMFLHFILRQCAALMNFTIEGEFMEHPAMKRLLIYNTYALDSETVIAYASHLPEITFPELLKELRKLFNLYLAFDVQNRVLTIRFCEDLMQQPTRLNWTEKAEDVHTKAPNLANRLELDWERDGNDALMKTPPADFDKYQTPQPAGGLLYAIKSRWSSLDLNLETGLARTSQAGITDVNNQGSNHFSPRLLFWNGVAGGLPRATNQYSQYRLAWHGPNNLIERFWKRTEAWRGNTHQITKRLNLTATDLAKIDFHLSKGNWMKIHIRGVDYFIESVRVNLPLTGMAELKLWAAGIYY